jgi:hypothetical protein
LYDCFFTSALQLKRGPLGGAAKVRGMNLLATLLLLVFASAQQPAPPATPRVEFRSCPFECCRLGQWGTYDSVPVYAEERQSGPPLFFLLPRERFIADSANLHTLAFGVVRFRQPVRLADKLADPFDRVVRTREDSAWYATLQVPFARADTLLILAYKPERQAVVWAKGRLAVVKAFWVERVRAGADPVAVLERPLVREWWVLVSHEGRHGWIQAFGRHLAGSDACDASPLP